MPRSLHLKSEKHCFSNEVFPQNKIYSDGKTPMSEQWRVNMHAFEINEKRLMFYTKKQSTLV